MIVGNSPKGFQGFEPPNIDVNAPVWTDRITVLGEKYPDQWAKYGPYETRKSAQNTLSVIRSKFRRKQKIDARYKLWFVDGIVRQDDSDYYFIYLKVTPHSDGGSEDA